jgi:hypothetical protein
MAGPGILAGVHDEALPTALRGMHWEWTAAAKVVSVEAVKVNAVAGERHFHRNSRLHCPIIDPGTRHESDRLSGSVAAI